MKDAHRVRGRTREQSPTVSIVQVAEFVWPSLYEWQEAYCERQVSDSV